MLKNLSVINFRNFRKLEMAFSKDLNIIVAPNAKGKTNILEAIFMLSAGKSFKAKLEREVISHNEDVSSILAKMDDLSLEVKITTGSNNWPKKKLLVNGVARRMIDFAGNLKVVLFEPQDLDLVTGSPTLRRNFLDTVLSQTDREYRRALGSYEKGLRQRNRLLLRIREENISRSNLLFWNQLLIKNGSYVGKKREELINFINSLKKCNLKYDSSLISEGRLEQYKDAEVGAATTLVGPHRDDFIFNHQSPATNHQSLAAFGSRGEQRMAVLQLKMAELSFIEAESGDKPTLLLDDIFSELDHRHRKVVLDNIQNHQVIMTTADKHYVPDGEFKVITI